MISASPSVVFTDTLLSIVVLSDTNGSMGCQVFSLGLFLHCIGIGYQ